MPPGPANLPPRRWPLVPLALLYAGAVRCRNLYYDRLPGAVRHADLPVISIGNLTAGGSGKTPLVVAVAGRLREFGRRPAILTRGYRGSPRRPADEVLELRAALREVPVVVGADRLAGARAARREHGADCLVLDDGFQHRRLHRDLELVVIDGLDAWGGGWVLPVGRLREPRSSLRRAHLFVLSRSNQIDAARRAQIEAGLRRCAPGTPIVRAAVEPAGLIARDGAVLPPGRLAARRVLPVCGIGNPLSFTRLVETLDCDACPPLVFPDHHRYGPGDLAAIRRSARRLNADAVVTTRKDWVKLAPLWADEADSQPPSLLRIDVHVTYPDGQDALDQHLKRALEKTR